MPTLLSAIAQPTRQAILRLVWEHELSAGDIAAHFDVTFGAISQHLRILREVDAVSVTRSGKTRLYTANRASLGPLATHLQSVWSIHLTTLKNLAEAEEMTK